MEGLRVNPMWANKLLTFYYQSPDTSDVILSY